MSDAGNITQDTLNNLTTKLNQLKTSVSKMQEKMDQQQTVLTDKGSQFEDKQKQNYGQSQEMDDKLKLLDTRNKMLLLTIERNMYKKKVMFSLLSVIILLVIGMLCFYGLMNKKIPTLY